MHADVLVSTMAGRMRSLRQERGWSLQDVADRAGITKSHAWELEQGRSRNPTIATAVSIARALGVSLDHLTGLTAAEPPLHPEAMRIACEVDALLRRAALSPADPSQSAEGAGQSQTPGPTGASNKGGGHED